MAKNGPGKHYRKGIPLMEAMRMFDTEEKAEAWFVRRCWPNGPVCPQCGSNDVNERASRKPQPYRCRACRKYSRVKTGPLLHHSQLPLSKWAIAFYMFSTHLKGVSSMKLHHDLGITQKSAGHMAHRVRKTWSPETEKFAGQVA